MEIWLTLFVASLVISTMLVFLLAMGATVFLVVRELRKAQASSTDLAGWAIHQAQASNESQAQLLDKAVAILSAKGPLEFQALQAMNQTGLYTDRYDPSDEAEEDRMRAFGLLPDDEKGDLNGAEGISDSELDFLRTHGVPGFGQL